jgi:hypothetical protein
MTKRTILFGAFIAAFALASSRAQADSDASIDGAGVVDAASDGAGGAGGDEAPVGLQPTVFDSNLGCSVGGAPAADVLPLVSGTTLLAAAWFLARAGRKGRRR